MNEYIVCIGIIPCLQHCNVDSKAKAGRSRSTARSTARMRACSPIYRYIRIRIRPYSYGAGASPGVQPDSFHV